MRVLVTGSCGHLGEALMRVLPGLGIEAVGLDLGAGPFTVHVGSITDRQLVRRALESVDAVLHTATLHKPHVATHPKQDFIDTNITGTLTLLEEAVAAGVSHFVFTSTTSAFGAALTPAADEPATWIDETVPGIAKNIYGATKTAAEDLCLLFARKPGLRCTVLRTSRFFPEPDDNRSTRDNFADQNTKANEFLYRRADLEDVASAHIAALRRVDGPSFAKYIVSAATPFTRADLAALRRDPWPVVTRLYPEAVEIYGARGYRMFSSFDRVYDSSRARAELGWRPVYDFGKILQQLRRGEPIGSELARTVGAKGYHDQVFEDGPFPVE